MLVEFDNLLLRISEATEREISTIRRRFKTEAPGYKYDWRFKRGIWDGKVSLFNEEFQTLPVGFLPEIAELFPRAQFQDDRNSTPLQLHPTRISLRPYQAETLQKAFGNSVVGTYWPRGVIQACTGAGKTRIAGAMIDMTHHLKTVFLVHRQQLGIQTRKSFEELGVRMENVEIMTIQSLMSWDYTLKVPERKKGEDEDDFAKRMATFEKRKATQARKSAKQREYLASIQQVFVDEAHLVAASEEKGNLFTRALALMPNATLRWGLTGTPFMRDAFHDWMLEGSTGKALCRIRTKQLIDLGYLPKPRIIIRRTEKVSLAQQSWPQCYEMGVVYNEKRNAQIVDIMRREQGPLLTFITRKDHGDLLEAGAREAGLTVKFVHGDTPIEEREQAAADLASGKVKVVIASSVWDEGMDIPAIRSMILAGGGKASTKNIQRLGRALRGTGEVRVFDFHDGWNRTLKSHSLARKKLWLDEEHDVTVE